MLSESVLSAFNALTSLLGEDPSFAEELHGLLGDESVARNAVHVPDAARSALITLAEELPGLSLSREGTQALGTLLDTPASAVVLAWAEAVVADREVALAQLLQEILARPNLTFRGNEILRRRIVLGPLRDALGCAPLLGHEAALSAPEQAEVRARLEILLWEAGASALEVPHLGPWLWGDARTFEDMIGAPASGTLRGRVVAARCLEVSVRGMPPSTDQELVGKTLRVLQPLLLHPEPLVWVHAARALGRLTGPFEQMEGTLLDWVLGESPLLRQRAMTAFASLPRERLQILGGQLGAIIDDKTQDATVLAALAAATPYLFFERRDLWDRLADRILAGHGGAVAARSLARGLSSLWRRGNDREAIEAPLRALRELSRRAQPRSLDEARRYIEVIAVTDAVDDAERDPLDLERGLENLVRVAAQYDDEEADARAERFALAVLPTFLEAQRIALSEGRTRQRAAAINALEGGARAFALRLWGPLLSTHSAHEPIPEPKLEETWKVIARAPAEILDLVRERRQAGGHDEALLLSLEILSFRLGGYALDACGQDAELGPGRGPTANETCLWLRKLDGLADGSRELPASLKAAMSSLLWRLVDTTQGTALGEVDDVRWLGPFAAWWALVIDRPAMLEQLATALPMMAEGALSSCCTRAETLRTCLSAASVDGSWGDTVAEAMKQLHADETELAAALFGLSRALGTFSTTAGPKANLEPSCLELVLASDRLHAALSDPVKGLHPESRDEAQDSLRRSETENAPRVAALLARAIRVRDPSVLDVWFASQGPVTQTLLEAAVQAAIKRTPPPPPAVKPKEKKVFEGYELMNALGEGGIGRVWLVRKPGADRLFVLKIPKADVLESASDTEREGILKSFVEEAKALAGLYHPNVANIIDRGVSENMPYLVLEYLIGADLKQYAGARHMTLFELRQIVLDACAGLASLHGAGLVHRDIKPANLWLRLPLQGGERFDGDKHRDPGIVPPLSTVVIDFGMVRASRIAADAAGKFVAGTAGYIAPEQVLDPVELDYRSDVYALAGTIYNVTTGRSFFDDIENNRDRILAHMKKDPLEDPERLRTYPVGVARLLRAATARDPRDRPSPLEFGRAFAAAL
jgi:serine/threonine-protein kinase